MATSKQAAHGLFWSTLERVATQGISFVVVLLLAKLLGPHNYGLVTLAATIALLGQMLLGETFSQALIQEKAIARAHTSSLFWLLAGFGLFATAVLCVCAGPLAKIFGQPALAAILRALSPLFLLAALQAVPAALFKRELDFRALAAASTLGTLLGGAVGLTLAFRGFGVWSLVANLLVQNTVVTITIWHRSKFFPALEFSRPHLHALWSYGQYTLLLRIAAFTANQSPRLIVGYLFGPAALGAFSLGLRIVEILYQLLVIPATNVMVPMVARIRDTPERLAKAVLEGTQLVAMVAVPVYIALAITAPIVIPMFFGERWMASVPLVQILSVYGVIGSLGLIWQSIVGGLGRPDIALRTTVLAAITSVAVLLLAARWGLTAAAGAFVLRGYITLPFMPLVLARLTGIPAARQYRALIPVAAASAIMAVTISLLMAEFSGKVAPLLLLIFALASGGAAYAAALLVFAKPAISERVRDIGSPSAWQDTSLMIDPAHRYVFICGLHRSGTTLITRSLMEHPQISGFRNSGVIEDEGQYLQTVMPLETLHGGVGRFGFDPRAHFIESSALNTAPNAKKLLSEWQAHWDMTRPVLMEKTPGNLLRMRLLEQLVQPSYFVVVTRHPIAVSLATLKWTEGNLFSLFSHWLHCYRIAKTDAAELPRVLWTSYEAFVARPQAEMGRILDFVGLASSGMSQLSLKNENDKYFALWSKLYGNGDRGIRQPPPEHHRSLVTRLRERIAYELNERSLPTSRRKASLGISYDALDAAALFEEQIGEFGYSFHDIRREPLR